MVPAFNIVSAVIPLRLPKPLKLLLLAAVLVASTFQLTYAGGVVESRAQLENIRKRIDQAENKLQLKKQSELNLSRELALIRRTLKVVDGQIRSLKKELAKTQGEVARQQSALADSRRKADKVLSRLKKRLVALYKEGDVGPLKILFSADSMTEMVQQYHYLSRVLKHDKELLAEYRKAIEDQQQQLNKLNEIQKKEATALKEVEQQRKVSAQGKRLQTRLLNKARAEKKKLTNELAQLKVNAARLKKLIARLERPVTSTPGIGAGSFAVGRGKLVWPVNGRVVIGFGKQQDKKLGTYYESNGIEIATPPGSSVHAVAAGKVVFADYFKGYGNLFILSHPGGYHTLYAQLDKLVKKLGDKVAAGELLGKSGLAGRDSIYFEIRSKGSPVNPLAWLKRR